MSHKDWQKKKTRSFCRRPLPLIYASVCISVFCQSVMLRRTNQNQNYAQLFATPTTNRRQVSSRKMELASRRYRLLRLLSLGSGRISANLKYFQRVLRKYKPFLDAGYVFSCNHIPCSVLYAGLPAPTPGCKLLSAWFEVR